MHPNSFLSDLRKKFVHTFQTILRFFLLILEKKKCEFFFVEFVHYFVDGSNVFNVLLIFFSSFHPMGGAIWQFGPPLFGYGGGHGPLAPPPIYAYATIKYNQLKSSNIAVNAHLYICLLCMQRTKKKMFNIAINRYFLYF